MISWERYYTELGLSSATPGLVKQYYKEWKRLVRLGDCLGDCCGGTPYKEENTMYDYVKASAAVTVPETEESKQRRHFLDRLDDIRQEQKEKLRDAFGMNDPTAPKTVGELKEWLSNGSIIVRTDRKDDAEISRFAWTSMLAIKPTVEEDKAGYYAAKDRLDAGKTAAQDLVWAGDAQASLKAVQDFQSADFTS